MYDFTVDELKKWKMNENINPRTNRTIEINKGVWKQLNNQYNSKIIITKNSYTILNNEKFTIEELNKWKINDTINPKTKRNITKFGSVWKKLNKQYKEHKNINQIFINNDIIKIENSNVNDILIEELKYLNIYELNYLRLTNKQYLNIIDSDYFMCYILYRDFKINKYSDNLSYKEQYIKLHNKFNFGKKENPNIKIGLVFNPIDFKKIVSIMLTKNAKIYLAAVL